MMKTILSAVLSGPAASARARIIGRVFYTFALAWAFLLPTGCFAHDASDTIPFDARSNEVILTWNTIAHDAGVAHDQYVNPMAMARVFALLHLAQHDAINAVDPAFETYAFGGADTGADPVAAAASAAHAVLAAIFPDQRAVFDEKLTVSLATVADGDARTRGVALGAKAAAAVLALRQNDGSDTPLVGDYVPAKGPGKYQFTPPFDFCAAPGWQLVKPFALDRTDQFRPGPPPALGSEAYAAAFNEVKAIGAKNSETRSPDQLAYAKFWYEFSDIGWNRIARVVATDRGLGLQSTARLFALLNMVMSDAYVAGWDAKFHYDLWRPITAIHAAGEDGNGATAPDPAWEPAMPTPPVQDYPSTHSALGRGAATVLASVFGDQTAFAFTSTSADPAYPSRSFTGFGQAADENADSRVTAGIHFRFATDAGQQLGAEIGRWTLNRYLQKR